MACPINHNTCDAAALVRVQPENAAPLSMEHYMQERAMLCAILQEVGQQLAHLHQQCHQQELRAQLQNQTIDRLDTEANGLRQRTEALTGEVAALTRQSAEVRARRFDEQVRHHTQLVAMIQRKETARNTAHRSITALSTGACCIAGGPAALVIYPVVKVAVMGCHMLTKPCPEEDLWDQLRLVKEELDGLALELGRELPAEIHAWHPTKAPGTGDIDFTQLSSKITETFL